MPVIGQGDKDKKISFEISMIRYLVLAILVILRFGLALDVLLRESSKVKLIR